MDPGGRVAPDLVVPAARVGPAEVTVPAALVVLGPAALVARVVPAPALPALVDLAVQGGLDLVGPVDRTAPVGLAARVVPGLAGLVGLVGLAALVE